VVRLAHSVPAAQGCVPEIRAAAAAVAALAAVVLAATAGLRLARAALGVQMMRLVAVGPAALPERTLALLERRRLGMAQAVVAVVVVGPALARGTVARVARVRNGILRTALAAQVAAAAQGIRGRAVAQEERVEITAQAAVVAALPLRSAALVVRGPLESLL
jgi:hypothetical protein